MFRRLGNDSYLFTQTKSILNQGPNRLKGLINAVARLEMALENFTGDFKEPFYEKNIRLIHGDYENLETNTKFEY